MSKCLLDASALLKHERGSEAVEQALVEGAAISSVNLSETLAKLVESGMALAEATTMLKSLPLVVLPFGLDHACACAELRGPTRRLGLSLADRACLATARIEGRDVLTNDRIWASLDLGIAILVVR